MSIIIDDNELNYELASKVNKFELSQNKVNEEISRILNNIFQRSNEDLIKWGIWIDAVKKIDVELDKTISMTEDTLENVMSIAYFEGFNDTVNSLRRLVKDLNIKVNTNTLKILLKNTIAEYKQGIADAKKSFRFFFRQTQQRIVQDYKISEAMTEGYVKYNKPEKIASAVETVLQKKILGGKYLTINGRNYNIASYAKTVARTRLSEAHSAGVIDAAINNKYDLVKVSSHQTQTDICEPFEGNIYSLSGTSNKYPKLRERPPFHPNCLHVINIYIDPNPEGGQI